MIEAGIFQLLKATGPVTDIVGTNIFPLWKKDMPNPSVVFQGVTGMAVTSLDGENQLRVRRFQFDCYTPAASYFIARELSDAVRAALVPISGAHGYPYTLPDGTVVQSATVHLDLDMPVEQGSGGYVARALLDIEFAFVTPS